MAAENVTIGAIIAGTLRNVVGNLPAVALYLAVFATGGSAGQYLGGLGTGEYEIAGIAVELAFTLGALVGGYLLLEAMLKRAGLLHHHGPRRFFAYVGQGILIGLGVLLGMMLLIVPGVILAVRWAIASPLLVGSGAGAVDGIKASWEMTRGHGVKIFVACLPLGLVLLLVLGMSVGWAGDNGLAVIVAQNVAAELLTVLVTALSATLFGMLVPGRAELREVFA